MNYYLEAFRKYAVFSGRAKRAEYWYFVLFNAPIIIVLWIIGVKPLIWLYYSVTFIPGLALSVRRLHDINFSGRWYFISLIPFAGLFIIIFWFTRDSWPGENKYGPNPKFMGTQKIA